MVLRLLVFLMLILGSSCSFESVRTKKGGGERDRDKERERTLDFCHQRLGQWLLVQSFQKNHLGAPRFGSGAF